MMVQALADNFQAAQLAYSGRTASETYPKYRIPAARGVLSLLQLNTYAFFAQAGICMSSSLFGGSHVFEVHV